MVDGSTRRLPMWMVVDDADKKKKKTMSKPKQNSTLSITNNKCGSKTTKSNKNVLRTRLGKKRKAKDARDADADSDSDSDASTGLTVDDLVSIAQEYLKANEDSERKQLLNRNCPTIDSSTITNAPYNEIAVNLTSQHSSINVSRTENPAQDMLDLFLGPFLKKPQSLEDESRTEFVMKNMDLAYELRKQTQNDVGQEMEMGPLTKKKSSLKHKVSLLLD